MRDIAFVAGLLVMLPFVFVRPHVGALLWAWTAFLVPTAFLYGFANAIPFNAAVAVTTLGAWLLSREPIRVPLNRTVFLLALFAVVGTLSASMGIGDRTTAWGEWEKFIKVICFAIVVVALINTRFRFIAMAYAIILSLGFLGVMEGLKVIATGGAHRLVGPGRSMIADNNHFALAILCTVPLVFFAYQQATGRLLRLTLLGVGALLVFAVAGTFSRGGLIGLVAMAVWAFFQSRRKVRYVAFVLPVAIALVAFVPDRWINRMENISNAEESASFMARIAAWKQSAVIGLDNPVLGAGFHATQNHWVWNKYRFTKFHELDFIPSPDPGDIARASHSIYLQVFSDLGFSGLLLFVALAITAWRNSQRVAAKARTSPDLVWASQLAVCLQYSLVAYFVAGAALSMAYFELIYVYFAMLAGLESLVNPHRKRGHI